MEERQYSGLGRRVIYTDAESITEDNVIQELQNAMITHIANVIDMDFLINYEKGVQPLQRKKVVRPDIDIKIVDNVVSEITEFKVSYCLGNPITYIQRGDRADGEKVDTDAIYALNELLDAEESYATDQETERMKQICGIANQFVDIKRDWREGDAYFDLVSLDPRSSFVVYRNDALKRKMMGVSYATDLNGNRHFTVFTRERRYEIDNMYRIVNGKNSRDLWQFGNRSGEVNPLGEIPIVEFQRSYDRMGCFERVIALQDALNITESDFLNGISQETQNIWWGNDLNFPEDENGNIKVPSTGQWILSSTNGVGDPRIQPLTINTERASVLNDIQYKRDSIKSQCFVPTTSDPGGGSTGTAYSMSSGWQNAEIQAAKEELLIRKGKMEVADLVLRAIKKSPDTPADSPLLKLTVGNLRPSVTRNKTYDMATKANTLATLVSHGVAFQHALRVVELFPDVNLVFEDSKPTIKRYLDKVFADPQANAASASNNANTQMKDTEKRNQQDASDQGSNSPFVNSLRTDKTGGE